MKIKSRLVKVHQSLRETQVTMFGGWGLSGMCYLFLFLVVHHGLLFATPRIASHCCVASASSRAHQRLVLAFSGARFPFRMSLVVLVCLDLGYVSLQTVTQACPSVDAASLPSPRPLALIAYLRKVIVDAPDARLILVCFTNPDKTTTSSIPAPP